MTSSSGSLVTQLQDASASGSAAAVQSLLGSFAPQLMQLEQQRETGQHQQLDEDTLALERWVREYAHRHETDASGVNGGSSTAISAAGECGPAPLFFYLLHHGHGSQHSLCTAFLSALYTDPASDQEYYWLNDPLAFIQQLREKNQRAKQEGRARTQQYALTKRIDVDALLTQVTLFSGLYDVIQTLLSTRARALTSQLNEVHALLEDVTRQRLASRWQLWLAQAGAHGELLLALDEALSASNESSWHQTISSRRALKSSSHSRAFRQFLQNVQAGDRELAALLVDEEYSEEPELFVDRLWSLASNSFQHQHHMEEQGAGASDQQQLGWSYPPPSVHSLLEVFLLPDSTASASPDSTLPSASPPPSYKVWLVYYLLLDFESRSAAGLTPVSAEFAHQAGLNQRQCTLIEGMLHMDAAYDVSTGSQTSTSLSPLRHASFVRALTCFSADYDALLSQADFPMVSSVLASVIVLQQWSAGVTFFQNCFIANAAAAASVAAHALAHAQVLKFNATRKLDQRMHHEAAPAAQVQVVFYSTLHHVFYVHILMQQGLAYEAIQFIRGQADDSNDTAITTTTTTVVNSPLQLTLWHYWNQHILSARKYHVLLKQVSLSEIEEEIVLAYWKKQLAPNAQTTNFASPASTNGPPLSTADLIILYHFEHHAIGRGLRFHAQFQARQSKLAPAQRVQLRLPKEMLAAYAKLVQHDQAAADEGESDDEHELDLAFIQLRGLGVTLARQQAKNAPFLAQILAAGANGDLDESVHMRDASRPGSDLNPFAPVNEQLRAAAAAAAVAAAARAKPAAPARSPPPPPTPAAVTVAAPAPVAALKSPEKTPRVQKVSATLSAAKAKKSAQQKEKEAEELKQAEAQAKRDEEAAQAQEQAQEDDGAMDEEDAEAEEAAASFPSFASPAPPRRTHSTPTPITPSSSTGSIEAPRSSTRKAAVLVSTTKPLAFSEMGMTTPTLTSTAAPFLLPLPEEEQVLTRAPSTETKATRPKRATRASSSDSAAESAAAAASSSFAPVLAPAVLPDSSQFAPSLLAPSASIASTRLKSSRKRPLLSALPTHLPLGASLPAPSPARRATRGRGAAAGADEAESDEESLADAETEAPATTRRQARLLATPSTTRKVTRRTAAVHEEDDAEMAEVTSAAVPLSTRSTRRTAAPSPPPSEAPQRGGSTSSRRPARTDPLFIDESLLTGAGSSLSLEEVRDDEDEEAEAEPAEVVAAVPKRSRSSRVSRLDANVTPSPAESAHSSPARTRTSSRKTAASPAPTPSLSMPLPSRATRTRASVDPALPAPTPRRATRQTAAPVEEETAPVTRATRSKAK